ncbi:MAG TPA: dephospho-CoA kinase, partial [Sphaerochaetaceae bacterium]|nr:dephospho-CoA kinase [Sphaerochaetaceae bacterium]
MGENALIVIGLTGKYCAGKNHVASLLEQRNLEVIDVDALGHDALERSKDELTALFGRRIIDSDGTVNRQILGEIVFSDQRSLATLEGTVHPRMVQLCVQQIEQYRAEG